MMKTTAGIPTANKHAQMALNIVKIGKPVSTVLTTVYSRRDAVHWLLDAGVLDYRGVASGLKSAFRNGGRIFEVAGYRVVKTRNLAPHRSIHNDATRKDIARRRRLQCSRMVTVTEWRKV